MLRRGRYASRVSLSAAAYLAATLEFLTGELIGCGAKITSASSRKTKRITPRALTLGVRNDADLGALLRDVTLARGGVLPTAHKALEKKKKKKRSKAAAVRHHRGSQRA